MYTGNRWYETGTFMNSGCGSQRCPARCNTSWQIISKDRPEWHIDNEFHIDCKGVCMNRTLEIKKQFEPNKTD